MLLFISLIECAMSAQSSVNSRSRTSSYVVLVRITSTNVSRQPTFANSFLYSFLCFRPQCWMISPPWFADRPGWSQLCLWNFFIAPPPIGDSSVALMEGRSVALAGYGRHCELRVSDKTTFTQGSPYV